MNEQQSIHERMLVEKSERSELDDGSEVLLVVATQHPETLQDGTLRPLDTGLTIALDPETVGIDVGDELSVSVFVYPPAATVTQHLYPGSGAP